MVKGNRTGLLEGKHVLTVKSADRLRKDTVVVYVTDQRDRFIYYVTRSQRRGNENDRYGLPDPSKMPRCVDQKSKITDLVDTDGSGHTTARNPQYIRRDLR